MKICMIATRHSLDDARVVHKESISLLNAGHDVSLVLSCNDRYEYKRPDGSLIAVGKSPNGETYYKGLKIYGRPKKAGLRGKYLTYKDLSSIAAAKEADVYHAHEPDLALAIAIRAKNILSKRKKRALVVHDMHEFPPGGPTDKASFCLKFAVYLAHIAWNKLTMYFTDHVFTANTIVRGYALLLNRKSNPDVLYNGPSIKHFFEPCLKSWPMKGEKLLLCHEGSLPYNRGLKEMVEAVNYLRKRVILRIVGDVYGEERAWLMKKIEDYKLQDVIQITGWLPYEKVSQAVSDCHVGLILFRDCINNRMAGPPNKLFNYMISGLPILSVDFPEMRQIITEEECGDLIHDQSAQSIIRSIEKLLTDPGELIRMSRNGQNAIRCRYSWEIIEKKLISAYTKMEMQITSRT